MLNNQNLTPGLPNRRNLTVGERWEADVPPAGGRMLPGI